MAREPKVFQVSTADTSESIPFKIVITNRDGETRTVEFEAYGSEPADATMILSKMSRVNAEGDSVVDGAGLAKFLDRILVGESKTRWQAMIDDEDWKIKAEVIKDIFAYVQEQWSGRPTVRPSNSSDGPSTTSPNSTESASSGASTS